MGEALGQHFLADEGVVARLLAAASPRPGESALDLGAGHGAIALPLARAVGPSGSVLALELDMALAGALRARAPANLRVAHADALEAPLPAADLAVANPPFRVAAPLLLRLLDAGVGRAVLVLPRELADRLRAPPGTERYGRLTVQVQVRAACRVLFPIPRAAFAPPPRVPACAVRLDRRPPPPGLDLGFLGLLLEAAWARRDRTLRHGLAPLAPRLRMSSGLLTGELRARGWEGARPGQLAPAEWAALARALQPEQRPLAGGDAPR